MHPHDNDSSSTIYKHRLSPLISFITPSPLSFSYPSPLYRFTIHSYSTPDHIPPLEFAPPPHRSFFPDQIPSLFMHKSYQTHSSSYRYPPFIPILPLFSPFSPRPPSLPNLIPMRSALDSMHNHRFYISHSSFPPYLHIIYINHPHIPSSPHHDMSFSHTLHPPLTLPYFVVFHILMILNDPIHSLTPPNPPRSFSQYTFHIHLSPNRGHFHTLPSRPTLTKIFYPKIHT